MKTVFNYFIAGVFVVALFIGVIRGAGFAVCNVDAYGFKADQVSLVLSSEAAKAPALTCPKKANSVKAHR
ncbi:hypothetical protein LVQ77_22140 [Buttiauxella sp. S04-F03]|uniref:hypothetical protein n=1 Tax=Buttiauxella sp. W03-F01 TaxID=2904524 RepID=UPI001E36A03B|nr:hypothetical protein [Buttiauxella sp. W03-F01]MCE0802968.1 hypothetical protein [Buttiauxella sp. W03-F01]